MRYQMSPEQVQNYQRDGFLIVENFLDADELANWRHCTDEAVQQRISPQGASKGFTNKAEDGDDNFYAQVFLQCLKLAESHEGMRQIIHDPHLGEAAATLAGVDGVRIWHDQALIKQPYGNATAWHLDNPYWSFTSRDSISIWVALDDATRENGCMYYLPGTHKTATGENSGIGFNQRDLFKIYPAWQYIDSVCAACPAGSAVFHNGLTAHGAGANMTARPRRAMTCGYMPDGCTFNGITNVLPPAYQHSLQVGDVLNDDTINPLVWHRDMALAAS